MNPGVRPLSFYSNPWVLRMQCKECEIDNSFLHFTQFNKCTHEVSQIHNSLETHKKVLSGVANCRNVPFAGERRRGSRVRFPKEEKMRGVTTNVYLWKTLRKPKETGQNETSKFESCIYV